MLSPIEIFCCYAHKDRPLLQELLNHLTPLEQQGLIQIWSDHDINAGVEWEREIEKHLEASQIILLLVSSDFLASKYIYSKEMKRAMQRHEQNEARVIPILLRHCNWEDAPFAKLQILPTGAEPVSSWSDKDKAFTDIAKQISNIVKEMRQQHALSEANKNDAPDVQRLPRRRTSNPVDVLPFLGYSLVLRQKQPISSNDDIDDFFDGSPSSRSVRPQKQVQAPSQRRIASPPPRRPYRDLSLDNDGIVDESSYATPRRVGAVQIRKKSGSNTGSNETLARIIASIMFAVIMLAIAVGIPVSLYSAYHGSSLIFFLFIWFYIGIVTGFLVSIVMRGGGYGVVGDIVVGCIGALIGGFMFMGLTENDWISGIGAFIVACISISILRTIAGSTRRV